MGERSISKLVAWAFGLAPVVLLLATWGTHLTPLQKPFQVLALPMVAVELATIIITALHGLKLPRPPLWVLAALLAWIALAWGTAVTAEVASASILRTILWTIHLLFGLAIANLVAAKSIEPADFPAAISTGFVLFGLLFCAFVASAYRPGYDWVTGMPAYGNIRWFGYYAAAVIGLCALGFVRARRGYWAIAVLALGLALWSGSRGTLYAVVAGYIVAFAMFPAMRRGWRLFLGAVACGISLAAVLTLAAPIGDGALRMSDVSSSGRVELWQRTLGYIADRPLLGWGEGQFRFTPGLEIVAQPHNVVLQILFAWGAVGLFLVSVLALWLTRGIVGRTSEESLPLVLAILNIAAFSFIDGALFHVQSVATFVLCLALVAAPRSGQ